MIVGNGLEGGIRVRDQVDSTDGTRDSLRSWTEALVSRMKLGEDRTGHGTVNTKRWQRWQRWQ